MHLYSKLMPRELVQRNDFVPAYYAAEPAQKIPSFLPYGPFVGYKNAAMGKKFK